MFFFLVVYLWKIATNNCAFHEQMKETLDALIFLSYEKVCVFLVVESIHVRTSLTMILFITAKEGGGREKGECIHCS